MNTASIKPIDYPEPLRKVLFEDFKSLGKELPIKGGWGYTKETAIIIDKHDPVVDKDVMFDGVGLEYLIAEKRIFEELIIFRSKGDKFSQIDIQLKEQKFYTDDSGKSYDHLLFIVSAIHDSQLTTEEQNKMVYEPEFWFEISSFV